MPDDVLRFVGRPPSLKAAARLSLPRRRPAPGLFRKVVDQLVAKAISGDISAIKEIADRVDGKIPQAIVGDDDHPALKHEMTIIERVIVDATNRNSESVLPPPEAEREALPVIGGDRSPSIG